MAKFITHEAIAFGCFRREYSPAGADAWAAELSNEDPRILDFLTQRLAKDYLMLYVTCTQQTMKNTVPSRPRNMPPPGRQSGSDPFS